MKFARETVTFKQLEEASHLFLAHHLEVSANPEMVLDPDPKAYVKAEENGILRWYSMRDDEGAIAGYFTFYVTQFLHHVKHKQAHQGLLYITPSERGKTFGAFLEFVTGELRKEGVEKIYFAASMKNALGQFFARKGMVKVSETYEMDVATDKKWDFVPRETGVR